MKIFNSIHEISPSEECSVSIGTFDGLHLGHIAVLEEMIAYARARDLATFVYTFSNNPAGFIRGDDRAALLIMDEAEKMSVLERMGIDYLASLPFDEEQLHITADSFVHDILLGRIHAKNVTVGHDFRFGQGGKSTIAELRDYGERFHFRVSVIAPVMHGGKRISSTDIRALLAEGKVRAASELLGREYFLVGDVVSGAALGRKLGIPTINLNANAALVLKRGVYFTICHVGGASYPSITNIGYKPTVSSGDDLVVETHLFDFGGDLYGTHVKLDFLKWHREERKFASKEELATTIMQDMEAARAFFSA